MNNLKKKSSNGFFKTLQQMNIYLRKNKNTFVVKETN